MQLLFKLLKYGSVALILIAWFPLQFFVVSSLLQLALAVIATGCLVATLLPALARVAGAFGVKLTAGLNKWFVIFAPAALAPPIHLYVGLETYWYGTYYYCDTCGWLQFLALIHRKNMDSLLVSHLIQIGAVAAALYAILLVSSYFTKVLPGRSQGN